MSCLACRKKKKDLVYVRSLAIKLSLMNQVDVQIYTLNIPPIGQTYEFEPINPYRKTVVEYIYYKNIKK